MNVELAVLRKASDAIFDHLEKTKQLAFELDADLYWSIVPSERYLPYEEPHTFSIGQLSDDLKEVAAIANGDKQAIGYALVWLAALLRTVGEQTVG